MKTTSFKIRWLDAVGYEINLPGGASIVIDPYLSGNPRAPFQWEQIQGADYIILTHTHFDHTSDVRNLTVKYNSKIIVEGTAANALAHCFGINYDNIYPVFPGETYYFEDFVLETSRSKHNIAPQPMPGKGPELVHEMIAVDVPQLDGVGDQSLLNEYGSLFSLDYFITTKENMRIMVSSGALQDSSGRAVYYNAFEHAKKFAPNVVIRQATRLGTPENLAEVLSRYHAQIYFPSHHEAFDRYKEKFPDRPGTDEYLKNTDLALQKINGARLVNPIKGQWYTLGFFVD